MGGRYLGDGRVDGGSISLFLGSHLPFITYRLFSIKYGEPLEDWAYMLPLALARVNFTTVFTKVIVDWRETPLTRE